MHPHLHFHGRPSSVSECYYEIALKVFLVVVMEHVAVICLGIYPQIAGTKILKQETKSIEIFLQP